MALGAADGSEVRTPDRRRSTRRRFAGFCVGAIFVAIVFVLLPWLATVLNAHLGWPRWQHGAARVVAVPLFLAGLGVALHCAGLFVRVGLGTPVPIDPPSRFVASGPYRFSRNPMYIAYVAILVSFFLYSGELALLLHAVFVALLLQMFLRLFEEPGLRRRFGESYDRYSEQVPRWIGVSVFGSRRAA